MEEQTSTIIELEHTLIEALLAGDDPMLEALRKQFAAASVSQRDFTGVGFFSHFKVAKILSPVTPANFDISDVFIEFENAESGAMAVLAVRNGMIDHL
jgi:hypothetical protein